MVGKGVEATLWVGRDLPFPIIVSYPRGRLFSSVRWGPRARQAKQSACLPSRAAAESLDLQTDGVLRLVLLRGVVDARTAARLERGLNHRGGCRAQRLLEIAARERKAVRHVVPVIRPHRIERADGARADGAALEGNRGVTAVI